MNTVVCEGDLSPCENSTREFGIQKSRRKRRSIGNNGSVDKAMQSTDRFFSNLSSILPKDSVNGDSAHGEVSSFTNHIKEWTENNSKFEILESALNVLERAEARGREEFLEIVIQRCEKEL